MARLTAQQLTDARAFLQALEDLDNARIAESQHNASLQAGTSPDPQFASAVTAAQQQVTTLTPAAMAIATNAPDNDGVLSEIWQDGPDFIRGSYNPYLVGNVPANVAGTQIADGVTADLMNLIRSHGNAAFTDELKLALAIYLLVQLEDLIVAAGGDTGPIVTAQQAAIAAAAATNPGTPGPVPPATPAVQTSPGTPAPAPPAGQTPPVVPPAMPQPTPPGGGQGGGGQDDPDAPLPTFSVGAHPRTWPRWAQVAAALLLFGLVTWGVLSLIPDGPGPTASTSGAPAATTASAPAQVAVATGTGSAVQCAFKTHLPPETSGGITRRHCQEPSGVWWMCSVGANGPDNCEPRTRGQFQFISGTSAADVASVQASPEWNL